MKDDDVFVINKTSNIDYNNKMEEVTLIRGFPCNINKANVSKRYHT